MYRYLCIHDTLIAVNSKRYVNELSYTLFALVVYVVQVIFCWRTNRSSSLRNQTCHFGRCSLTLSISSPYFSPLIHNNCHHWPNLSLLTIKVCHYKGHLPPRRRQHYSSRTTSIQSQPGSSQGYAVPSKPFANFPSTTSQRLPSPPPSVATVIPACQRRLPPAIVLVIIAVAIADAGTYSGDGWRRATWRKRRPLSASFNSCNRLSSSSSPRCFVIRRFFLFFRSSFSFSTPRASPSVSHFLLRIFLMSLFFTRSTLRSFNLVTCCYVMRSSHRTGGTGCWRGAPLVAASALGASP